jgi:hypothetical protein
VRVGEIVRSPISCNGASGLIGKEQLLGLKRKAMRAGVWFRALPRIDRVLVDLTIKVAQRIRSASLASCILSVTRKLEGLLESRFARAVREIGFPLSCRLSLLAQEWGNRTASAWAGDEDFARYLAVMKLNG